MCGICGCGGSEARIGATQGHETAHDHSHDHPHEHPHDAGHTHDHGHHHDHDHAREPAAGAGESRLIQVERDLLEANDRLASVNRELFAAAGVLALNLVSSPGSGKTTLLVRTLQELKGRWPLSVIEGDQETDNDAARVRATGVPALQVNTGKGCHLDARMVFRSFETLPLPRAGVLFIENVGNLVCPAGFDLGEAHKVVVASVTEGEDKPLKYPHMFAAVAADAGQQGRPAAVPALRCGGTDRQRTSSEPVDRGAAGIGRDRCRHRSLDRLDRARARGARLYQCRPRSSDDSARPSFEGLTSAAATPLAAAVSGNIW